MKINNLLFLFLLTIIISSCNSENEIEVMSELDKKIAKLEDGQLLVEVKKANGEIVTYEIINTANEDDNIEESKVNGRKQILNGYYEYRLPWLTNETNSGHFSVVSGYDNTTVIIGGTNLSLDEGDRANIYGNYYHQTQSKYGKIAFRIRSSKRTQVSVSRNKIYYERGLSVKPYEDCGTHYRTADNNNTESSDTFYVLINYVSGTNITIENNLGHLTHSFQNLHAGNMQVIQGWPENLKGEPYGAKISSNYPIAAYQIYGDRYNSRAIALTPLDR